MTNTASSSQIVGLRLIGSFVSFEEAQRIVGHIDAHAWDGRMRRRVQHYGYQYDYRSRSIDASMRAENLPPWSSMIGQRMLDQGHFEALPDQAIVNEYQPGQGIAAHVDCVPCFGGIVASLSMLSACVMVFERGPGRIEVDLQPGSLILLTGEARYQWKHSIAAVTHDRIDGRDRPRTRRISATFRTVLLQ